MPAVKLNREKRQMEALVVLIRKYAFAYGGIPEAAKRSGIGVRTFYNRLNNPSDLSLCEINQIAAGIHIPSDEMAPLLLWRG